MKKQPHRFIIEWAIKANEETKIRNTLIETAVRTALKKKSAVQPRNSLPGMSRTA